MSGAETTFAAELIRAANQIDKVSDDEIKALIFRAIVSARDLREQIGIPGSGTPADAVVLLYDTAMNVANVTSNGKAKALLEAAGLLRDLRVVAESGTRLTLWRQDQDLIL
ncbi:UNVERIFIED_ORG: hypothetical protein GGD47_002830 [Rhizobium etli]